jgi:hypothetical protein
MFACFEKYSSEVNLIYSKQLVPSHIVEFKINPKPTLTSFCFWSVTKKEERKQFNFG